MALLTSDYLPVNRNTGGTITAHKTTVADVIGLVPAADTPNLQEVTTEGATTDVNVTLAGVTADAIDCASVDSTGDVTAGDNITLASGTGEIQCIFIDGGTQDIGGGEFDYPDP